MHDTRESLLLRFAMALHRSGTPAHRLEGLLDQLSEHLKVEARIFSMPTAVFASLGPEPESRTVLLRVDPGGLDIGHQAELDRIAEGVLDDEIPTERALLLLEALDAQRSPWSALASVLAFTGTGASAAIVLGGGPVEAACSAVAGAVVGLFDRAVGRWPSFGTLFEPASTFAAMCIAVLTHHLVAPIDVASATLAAVIVLVPGLSLTTSVIELATRNLASGTARLAGALVTFVSMAVGAAVAVPLGTVLPASPDLVPPAFDEWVRWAVLPVVGLTLAVLLRARPRDTGWVVLAPIVAMVASTAGSEWLGPVLGVGAAAFVLALVSNLIARLRRRPASTMLTPGILLLVPGTMGLRAILRLVEHDVVAGVDGFFEAVLVATSLAAGVLIANVVVRPRQGL